MACSWRGWRAWRAWCLGFLALLFSAMVVAQEPVAVPALSARVTDTAGVLSVDEKAQLEAKLAAFEQAKGAQIAVLLVSTTEPESIEQFSIRAVDKWRLGRKGLDDGAMLLIAVKDQALRIEVGYGLEGALTDAVSKRIVSDVIIPQLKLGSYYNALDAGVAAMMQVISGEDLPKPSRSAAGGRLSDLGSLESIAPILFAVVFVGGGVLRAIFGRFLGAGMIATVAAGIVWFLLSSVIFAGVVAAIAFFVSLTGGLGRGRLGGGGFSGGGFGGGGFSGGGGGFGGGGASGRW